jgi:hypothetical protein
MSEAFPSSLLTRINRLRLDFDENKAVTQSLVTRFTQVTSLNAGTADRWRGVLETVPIVDATELRTMWAFLVRVGRQGEFTIKEVDYTGPISGQSSILVNGGSQSGTSLICDGATPSVICLREGEYFQVGTEFKMVTANATADGAGNVTVSFKPALRTSPANNAAVTLSNPQMLLRLLNDPSKDTDNQKIATFVLEFEESF